LIDTLGIDVVIDSLYSPPFTVRFKMHGLLFATAANTAAKDPNGRAAEPSAFGAPGAAMTNAWLRFAHSIADSVCAPSATGGFEYERRFHLPFDLGRSTRVFNRVETEKGSQRTEIPRSSRRLEPLREDRHADRRARARFRDRRAPDRFARVNRPHRGRFYIEQPT